MEDFSGPTLDRPLMEDETRVVWLYPGKEDDPICCELRYVPINHKGYFPLSYVWGDRTDEPHIYLNGTRYNVTKNLYAALQHMRHPEEGRLLWIDALCINHRDIDERSRQVMRMKDIYKNAKRVIIWIGDYAPHTKEQVETAFEYTSQLFQKIGKIDEVSLREYMKDTDLQIAQHIAEIMLRPWFSRIWIIQESAVCKPQEEYMAGPYHQLIFCGQSSIPFSTFTLMAAAISLEKK
jgi:hypothetical protein